MQQSVIELIITDKAISQFQVDYVQATDFALVPAQWLQEQLRALNQFKLENKALTAKVAALETTIQLADVRPVRVDIPHAFILNVHA